MHGLFHQQPKSKCDGIRRKRNEVGNVKVERFYPHFAEADPGADHKIIINRAYRQLGERAEGIVRL